MNVVLPKGVYSVSGETAIFSIHDKKDYEIHEIVQQVYDALKEKGYNPVNQLWAISCPKTPPTSRPIKMPVP